MHMQRQGFILSGLKSRLQHTTGKDWLADAVGKAVELIIVRGKDLVIGA